nr:hypothetical protein [Tanacetum cinerariifolium]
TLINRSVIAILKAHRFARHRQADATELSVHETFPLIKAMSELKLGAASVDLGKLAVKYKAEANGRTAEQFVREEMAEIVGAENDLVKRASLLRRDSVHGPFDGTITIDEANNTISANGNLIQVIYAKSPTEVDYTQYGIKDALL